MKSRGGKSHRRDRKKREDQRRDRSEERGCRRTKRSRKIAKQSVFPMICGSGGSKSTLAKAGAEPLAGWAMKNCMPLWHEADFQVKMNKNTLTSEHFWKLRCWKVYAFAERSTFGSQNVKNMKKHTMPGALWRVWCWKSARCCCAKHRSKSKCRTHFSVGALLEVERLKKCTPLWREPHFEVKMLRTNHDRATFACSNVVSRKGFCTLPKVSKTWGFCSNVKNVGKSGTFEEDLQRCISRGGRSTRDCQVQKLRKSDSIAARLMLSISKMEEVSQNSFVFKLAEK